MSKLENVKKGVGEAGMIVDESLRRYDSIRFHVEYERTCDICGNVGLRKCKQRMVKGKKQRMCRKCYKSHGNGGET